MNESARPVHLTPGVLAGEQLRELEKKGSISSFSSTTEFDGSALDLCLGKTAWKINVGQRPATRELAKLKAKSERLALEKDDAGEFFRFERNNIYLVQLDHHISLPSNINGRATGKSSIGRLDVITRLITNNNQEYDVVEAGYDGELYLLILPQTFSVIVPPGKSLNQLRLFSGSPSSSVITKSTIRSYGSEFWWMMDSGNAGSYKPWDTLLKKGERATADPNLFDLTVDLADSDCQFIYEAISNGSHLIDLRKPNGHYSPSGFFARQPIINEQGSHSVALKQGSFYIMKSKERLSIPDDVAVEVVAISERIGDIRIHYAGFAHPWFGWRNNGPRKGTPLIFEVRATDMDTLLYDGSLLARMQLFRMSRRTRMRSSTYGGQELTLSKYFTNLNEGTHEG